MRIGDDHGRYERSRSDDRQPLIESDRVEGTTVYDPRGTNIGSIKRLMIDKLRGKVAYAVLSLKTSTYGGLVGMGEEEHLIPWSKLNYDTSLGGYRTDITEEQLGGAPSFYRDRTTTGPTAGASRSCTRTGARPTTTTVLLLGNQG